jgi:hypothetical protein
MFNAIDVIFDVNSTVLHFWFDLSVAEVRILQSGLHIYIFHCSTRFFEIKRARVLKTKMKIMRIWPHRQTLRLAPLSNHLFSHPADPLNYDLLIFVYRWGGVYTIPPMRSGRAHTRMRIPRSSGDSGSLFHTKKTSGHLLNRAHQLSLVVL